MSPQVALLGTHAASAGERPLLVKLVTTKPITTNRAHKNLF